MDKKVNCNSEFRCNICNKNYASNSSLCNHNKKFHKNDVVQKGSSVVLHEVVCGTSLINNKSQCKYCNKLFNDRSNKYKHEKICKNKTTDNSKISELEDTINKLKKQVNMLLKEKGKIHHKTLQKINNQLNNINNGSIINNTYVKFGDVEYEKILNKKQIKQILSRPYQSLEDSIKEIHFNDDLPEYSNIFITNMKDDLAYVFNGSQFISVKKNEMLNELIDIHKKEINLSFEKNKNKLNETYVTCLEKFLDLLNNDREQFTDEHNNRTYPCYKAYKINSIKLLIYNYSDKKKLDILNNMELIEKVDEEEDDESSDSNSI